MNNKEKNIKYANLMEKLKDSIRKNYFYEAIFIEYAIFEDRFSSMLRHANLKYDGTLSEKIDRVKEKVLVDEYTLGHLPLLKINEIDKWRDERNKLIHKLVEIRYDDDEIQNVAETGCVLVEYLNNKSTLINKYNDKNNNR